MCSWIALFAARSRSRWYAIQAWLREKPWLHALLHWIALFAAGSRSWWYTIKAWPRDNPWFYALRQLVSLLLLAGFHLFIALVIWWVVVFFGIVSVSIDERAERAQGREVLSQINPMQGSAEPSAVRSGSTDSGAEVLSKYWASLTIVGAAVLLGWLVKSYLMRRVISKNVFNIGLWLPKIVKAGIVCGGLTAATTAASTAIMQALLADEKRLAPDAPEIESMALLAAGLVYIVVLAAYIGALGQFKENS